MIDINIYLFFLLSQLYLFLTDKIKYSIHQHIYKLNESCLIGRILIGYTCIYNIAIIINIQDKLRIRCDLSKCVFFGPIRRNRFTFLF